MTRTIKLILFDLDDTLIHSSKAIISHHIKVAEKMGIRVPTYREVAAFMGTPWKITLKKLWPEVDMEDFIANYRKYPKDHPLELIDGSLDVVREIQKRYQTGLLTARDERTTFMVLKDFEFPHFGFIATGSDQVTKPDPHVFTVALSAFEGIGAQETLYIGDGLTDCACALGAGVHFVGVETGNYSKDDFIAAGATHVISDITKLPGFLKECFE